MGIPRIYAVADRDRLGSAELPAAVEALAEAGVGWIQVRAKDASGAEVYDLVERSLRRLAGSAAALWVNDRVDVAALLPVAGVHLGQDDLEPSAARQVLGSGILIGRSTHGEAQLRQAAADDAVDVVALGPIFATRSKARPDPVVGLELLRRARGRIGGKPLVAIGGITAENVAEVLRSGADAVALIGALGGAREIGREARRLCQIAEETE